MLGVSAVSNSRYPVEEIVATGGATTKRADRLRRAGRRTPLSWLILGYFGDGTTFAELTGVLSTRLRERNTVMARYVALIAGTASLWLVTCVSQAQIEFEGDGATDVQLESALNHELRASGVTSQIENGVATLEGSVPSQADKDQAELTARRVEGVARVRNEIVVSYDVSAAAHAGLPLPGAVDAAVQARLANEVRLADSDIEVRSSDNNVVTLTGEVATEAEKAIAGRIAAETRSVSAVDNQLVVSH
jgi:hyperosmotically inducible periplasmic protein